ncbi:tellurite resistance protein TehA-like permease [Saccharothrix carnea]|uniref:Tellurite resistance protein TehA-like permease n=1 Tax=Saccharothrix carnea TaxID=1280637 RepID=A0A2P8HLM3_SACCR|nr:tellurite resistance/C4-dicarboxylate transporter family protein [Saccharothrix carnea]PSL47123.1 tellurite resistance protein TehA-like permease [Saccharothrix carnea]
MADRTARRPGPGDAWAAAVDRVPPSASSFVMASGIVATCLWQQDLVVLSSALLVIAIAGLVAIVVVQATRLACRPAAALRDAREPGRAFGYLTIAAALDVVITALASHGVRTVASGLLVLAAALWLVLTYAIPAVLVLRTTKAPSPSDVDGSWLLWVVGAQSLSIAVTAAGTGSATATATLGVALWSAGTVLYVVLTAIVLSRLLTAPNTEQTITPSYWILTGATAISVLAAVHVLSLPAGPRILGATEEFVSGTAIALWAFGTWWLPLLIIFGLWRYLIHHHPVRYETGLWSVVFPLGTYATASTALGDTLDLPFLRTTGTVTTAIATVAWIATTALMLTAAVTWLRGRTADDRGRPTAWSDGSDPR